MSTSKPVNAITEGVIWKQILRYFFPILLGSLFQYLYNTVDAVVVGKFVGTEALAAVGGPAGTLINLLLGFFSGLSSGGTVIISQFYGGNDKTQVSNAVHTALALSVAGGLVMMAVGIPFSRIALSLMHTPDDVIDLSARYMRLCFAGILPSLLYNIGSGILRAVGDSKRPLYFLIVCCFANIVLDLLFVVVFEMGVAGVAIATALAQTISAVLILITLMRTGDCFCVELKKIRFYGNILGNIVKIGLPAGLQSVMYSLSYVILQTCVNSFGTTIIAAYTAYGKLDGIAIMVMVAFGTTATTFVGQNFGARKFDRMRKVVRTSLLLTSISTVALEILLCVFAKPAMSLFSSDAAVIEQGVRITRFLVPGYVLYMGIEVFAGALRGTGDSFAPMLMTALGVCLIRVPWVLIGAPYFKDILDVLTCFPITWGVTTAMFLAYYLHGGWFKRRKRAVGFE